MLTVHFIPSVPARPAVTASTGVSPASGCGASAPPTASVAERTSDALGAARPPNVASTLDQLLRLKRISVVGTDVDGALANWLSTQLSSRRFRRKANLRLPDRGMIGTVVLSSFFDIVDRICRRFAAGCDLQITCIFGRSDRGLAWSQGFATNDCWRIPNRHSREGDG